MAHASAREVVVGDRGRVVLPSDIRAALGLEPGDRMLLSADADGSLRLRPYRAVAKQGLGLLADLAPGGESMVDELIAERRAEARREDAEQLAGAVLDASAVLAYLNREAGAEVVADLLSAGAILSAVNFAEVLSRAADRGVPSDRLIARLAEVGVLEGAISVEPFTVEDAGIVGELRPATRGAGLSLGDRACLALARRLEAPAVTADAAWAELDVGVEIRLIR